MLAEEIHHRSMLAEAELDSRDQREAELQERLERQVPSAARGFLWWEDGQSLKVEILDFRERERERDI